MPFNGSLRNLFSSSKSRKERAAQLTQGASSHPGGSTASIAVESASALSSQSASPSFFPNAQNFHLESFVYNEAPKTTTATSVSWKLGWQQLIAHTAPNALYNSSARFDAPKCDEDTRVGVIEEVMGWMTDRGSPTKLLCMTGAAGAGKSCLQQTIAEQCQALGILAASFFFWKSDPTRNNAKSIVATIAYQLAHINTDIRSLIGAAVEQDPLIFDKSLLTQIDILIVAPINLFRLNAGQDASRSLPYAILIDGLDECENVDRQQELLRAIAKAFIDDENSNFRIFIASRPEWTIYSALELPGGFLRKSAYHIRLSDDYDASEDIRRYLRRRLCEIGFRHGHHQWPTDEEIDKLVLAASGQFIYAATVVKYVSGPRSSPVVRLRTILTWKLSEGQRAAPFAALDLLYRNILTDAKAAYEEVDTNELSFDLLLRAYLSFLMDHAQSESPSLDIADAVFGLPSDTWQVFFCDLRSVVAVGAFGLRLYHKSFQDFLIDERRAQAHAIPKMKVQAFIMVRLMHSIPKGPLRFPVLNDTVPPRDILLRLLDFYIRDVILESLKNPGKPELYSHVYSGLLDFTRTGGWESFQDRLSLGDSADALGDEHSFLLWRVLCMTWEIGAIVFDPTISQGPGQSLAELGAAVQSWLLTMFNQLHAIHLRRTTNGGNSEVPYFLEPFDPAHGENSQMTIGDFQKFWETCYKPAFGGLCLAFNIRPSFHDKPSPAAALPLTAPSFSLRSRPMADVGTYSTSWKKGWDRLVDCAMPEAIYNPSTSFRVPPSDMGWPGVKNEMMGWITDRESSSNLLFLVGDAGMGKTCLQQSIAESSREAGILASTFFFDVAARTTPADLPATLAYQLGEHHPDLRTLVGAAVEEEPSIFKKSIREQLNCLIAVPVKHFQSTAGVTATQKLPYAILIDALDECGTKSDQDELLEAIQNTLLYSNNTPFRICISSRPLIDIINMDATTGKTFNVGYVISLHVIRSGSEDIYRLVMARLQAITGHSTHSRVEAINALDWWRTSYNPEWRALVGVGG